MQFHFEETRWLLRFEKGEELLETLTRFLDEHGIESGSVTAIGAIDSVTLGYYDPDERTYIRNNFPNSYELLSLNGNITMLENKPFAHLHAVIGDRESRVRGGHLFAARIAVTVEMVIENWNTIVRRLPDKETGLNLWSLD